MPLPIGAGQTISQPLVVARMCELLELRGGERILDVGTGSGYHAALLGRLGVARVERRAPRARCPSRRRPTSRRAGVDNVTLIVGDGTRGLPETAPFDAINVAAAAGDDIPPALEDQLGPDGRLVVPVETATSASVVVHRTPRRASSARASSACASSRSFPRDELDGHRPSPEQFV